MCNSKVTVRGILKSLRRPENCIQLVTMQFDILYTTFKINYENILNRYIKLAPKTGVKYINYK